MARSRKLFHDRVMAVIVLAAIVLGCVLFWDWQGWDRTSVSGAVWFGHAMFGLLAMMSALMAMAVAGQGQPSIASEREGKSLDSLLASRLSSAEVVLGMMATGLVRSAHWLAATVPVVILVAMIAGVQPRLVLLSVAGVISTALAGAALAVVVSVYAPNRSRARSMGIAAYLTWIDFPLLFEILQPRAWRGAPRWLVHALHWTVDSNPAGVGVSRVSSHPGPSTVRAHRGTLADDRDPADR